MMPANRTYMRERIRERVVERHLHKLVTRAGGTTRKFTGRKNNADRIVIWPDAPAGIVYQGGARVHFVECKRPKGKPRPGQVREHDRLRALGCSVFVLDTIEEVEEYVANQGR